METKIAIIGGGAGGFFTALRCGLNAKKSKKKVSITILEASSSFLRKVRISGGGRCNVTHNIFDSNKFIENYPRGHKELKSPFTRFQAQDTVNWFEKRGVSIKHESDGRMFPTTDSSNTIIDCFLKEAKKYNIKLKTHCNIKSIQSMPDNTFTLKTKSDSFMADKIMMATGSAPAGYKLAQSLGHKITDLAPSLFTFKISDPILKDLLGTSFKEASLTLKVGKKKFKQTGPLLITHWGLSGPGVLKLSAWAAREMKAESYSASLLVNWMGSMTSEDITHLLLSYKEENSKSNIANVYPEALTKSFWIRLLSIEGVNSEKNWGDISKSEINKVSQKLSLSNLKIKGTTRFKEEFVECGGINLKEVNFKTMESKICKNLYFSGEILDVDGITGGFNFQNAWTTGWIAGSHMTNNADML